MITAYPGGPVVRQLRSICHWTDDDGSGVWDTDCGHYFQLESERPEENGMKFCCYCGKTLVEVPYKEEDTTNRPKR